MTAVERLPRPRRTRCPAGLGPPCPPRPPCPRSARPATTPWNSRTPTPPPTRPAPRTCCAAGCAKPQWRPTTATARRPVRAPTRRCGSCWPPPAWCSGCRSATGRRSVPTASGCRCSRTTATGEAVSSNAAVVPVDAVTLAALLGREAAATAGGVHPPSHGAADRAELTVRVADSVRRTALFIAERRARPAAPPGTDCRSSTPSSRWCSGTRCIRRPRAARDSTTPRRAGTRRRPAARSRCTGWRWTARVLAGDSAWTRAAARTGPGRAARRRPADADRPTAPSRCRCTPGRPATSGTAPRSRALLDAGLLHDLGPHGDPWHPTSSVRTVYRPGAPAMLKLSLGVRITNSRRENLRKELVRGVEVHRLLRGRTRPAVAVPHTLASTSSATRPGWRSTRPTGEPVTGLDVDAAAQPVRARRRRASASRD